MQWHCPHCARSISVERERCRACGTPIRLHTSERNGYRLLIVGFFTLGGAAMMATAMLILGMWESSLATTAMLERLITALSFWTAVFSWTVALARWRALLSWRLQVRHLRAEEWLHRMYDRYDRPNLTAPVKN